MFRVYVKIYAEILHSYSLGVLSGPSVSKLGSTIKISLDFALCALQELRPRDTRRYLYQSEKIFKFRTF